MIKYFMISLIGIIVFMNGYCIKKGNIGLLHLHNRIMILNEDKDAYCIMIGRGLMIIGLGALISSLLSACLNNENYLFILLASSAIGVTMCYYAMFKYNMYRKIKPWINHMEIYFVEINKKSVIALFIFYKHPFYDQLQKYG